MTNPQKVQKWIPGEREREKKDFTFMDDSMVNVMKSYKCYQIIVILILSVIGINLLVVKVICLLFI